MNILIMAQNANLLGVADRLARDGHEIKVYSNNIILSGRGVFTVITIEEIYSAIKACSFIISDFDMSEKMYKKIAMFGKPLIGKSFSTDMVNNSCVLEYLVFDKFNIKTLKGKIVGGFPDIYDTITNGSGLYDIRYDRKSWYGKNNEFMAWAISQIPPNTPILIQSVREFKTQVRVIGLFNGIKFLNKKFMTNWNNAEFRHALIAPIPDGDKLSDGIFIKLVSWLKAANYRGLISLKISMEDDDNYVLEIDSGFVYPDLYAILEMIQNPAEELFNALATGNDLELITYGKYGAAIEAIITDYKEMAGAPIVAMNNEEQIKHIYPISVMKSDITQDDYFLSGEFETAYIATAYASDIDKVKERIMRTINNASFPQIKYGSHLELSFSAGMETFTERNFVSA